MLYFNNNQVVLTDNKSLSEIGMSDYIDLTSNKGLNLLEAMGVTGHWPITIKVVDRLVVYDEDNKRHRHGPKGLPLVESYNGATIVYSPHRLIIDKDGRATNRDYSRIVTKAFQLGSQSGPSEEDLQFLYFLYKFSSKFANGYRAKEDKNIANGAMFEIYDSKALAAKEVRMKKILSEISYLINSKWEDDKIEFECMRVGIPTSGVDINEMKISLERWATQDESGNVDINKAIKFKEDSDLRSDLFTVDVVVAKAIEAGILKLDKRQWMLCHDNKEQIVCDVPTSVKDASKHIVGMIKKDATLFDKVKGLLPEE